MSHIKSLTKSRRKKHLRNIQWCIETKYNALALCQMGFITDPMAVSVPIGKLKDCPSLSILPYLKRQ